MNNKSKLTIRNFVSQYRIESESDGDYRTVKLTLDGLNWADQECDKAPYTNYV
jgi:hypothetical protein